jgi:hypothetical protein
VATNKKLSMLVLASASVILCSCATPQEARSSGPVAAYASSKSAKAVTACVAAAWESAYALTNPVNVRPTNDGYTLQVSHSGNTMVVLDVTSSPSGGSTSKYYKGHVLFEGRWDEAVQSCQ